MSRRPIWGFALFLLTFLLFSSCGADAAKSEKQSDCKYGKPVAIFTPDHEAIKEHSFRLEGNNAFEQVSFSSGIDLELNQSGCNEIVQLFKFRIPGKHHEKTAENWVETAVLMLKFLSSLDEKYAAFSFWANEIESIKPNIKLGAVTDIKEGFKVKIDKVLSVNHSMVEIQLSK